jgi:hypothetical protein
LTKRLRNFNIFQTVYHFLCSDKLFRSNCKKNACKIEKFGNPKHLYSKLLLNGKKSANMINMKKLRLIYSFLMPYHLHQSDKRFKNYKQNSIHKIKNPQNCYLPYSKLLLDRPKFRETLNMNNLRNFIANPTVYHMHYSDEWYDNGNRNTL